MSPEVIDALVKMVANGKKFGVSDDAVVEQLIGLGVPKEHAVELRTEIAKHLQAGHDAAAAGIDHPAPDQPLSPLALAAFHAGRSDFLAKQVQRSNPRRTLLGVLVFLVLAALVYALVARW
jgi:hypothetical protein